jgi:pyrimidine operon attenuation protein/uracil phosphoribosyltransferase
MMLQLDAEALYTELREGVRGLLRPDAALVGIWSGGAWLAERLQADLGLPGKHGVISSTLHRDDFGARPGQRRRRHAAALRHRRPPHRADRRRALHRPHHPRRGQRAVRLRPPGQRALAVLVDRGGRELPIAAAFSAAKLVLPARRSAVAGARRRRPLQLQREGGA